MASQTLPFYDRVESALHDQTLQTALGRATTRFVANRANALEALRGKPDRLGRSHRHSLRNEA